MMKFEINIVCLIQYLLSTPLLDRKSLSVGEIGGFEIGDGRT